LTPFRKGIKIGIAGGLVLSLIVYTAFFLNQNPLTSNFPLNIFISPYALVIYKVLVLISPFIVPILFIKKFKTADKIDLGILSGVFWSFSTIQLILFLLDYPSIINDLIKGNSLILF
jgi:hypothetical protein